MLFGIVKKFKKAMRKYRIKNRHNFKFVKNNSNKFRIMFAAHGCPWLMYASLKNTCDKKDKTM